MISLHGMTVAYPVFTSGRQKSALAAMAGAMGFGGGYGKLARDANGAQYVVALRDVSLQVKEGTRLGLIGRNGSGKSTLLKAMAGIVTPSRGNIRVDGRIGCVLNLGTGLDAEKTGMENLRLIARLYGLNGPELKAAVEEASAFTELGPYLNLPVRTYSTGMMARLSFAIATSHRSDVMLIDEVIATGDTHFTGKAVKRVRAMCDISGMVVLASHSYEILDDFCDEVIWLDSGTIMARGPLAEVWPQYIASTS
jgi:ABC-type polysaccharide/polyol phosphate transport system ATPase subunit